VTSSARPASAVLTMVLAVLIAALCGLLVSFGSPVAVLLLVGSIVSMVLLVVRLETFLILLVATTFLVQGCLSYFLSFQQAAWIPYLLCVVATIRILLGLFARNRAPHEPIDGLLALTLGALAVHIATLLGGVALNQPSVGQAAAGLKNALPFWVVTALLLAPHGGESRFPLLWRLFYVTLFLQVPLVLVQHFVIRVRRADAESTGMDAVVGSFGGNMDSGGGANSTLVIFALFVMALQFARFLRGQEKWRLTLLIQLVGLSLIVLGEVKAFFIWLPLTIVYLLRHSLVTRPLQSTLTLSIMAVIFAATFVAYDALYWTSQSGKRSAVERIESMFYFFDPNGMNPQTGEVSRGASVLLWVNDHRVDPARRIIGHGSGSTRISATVGLGEVARRYIPLNIGATTLAVLLWDSGLLGTLSFAVLLFGSLAMAQRLGNHQALDSAERSQAEAIGVFMLIALTLLVYNRTLTDEPSTQLLFAFGVGHIALLWRIASRRERERIQPSLPARTRR
jgi:hypothetical protein